ncbi:MAG: exopolyphosphatase [Desulfobacterales bacterium]|nr:exopolyphosphatase [Desulfobacterales bacterium]
MRIITRPDFDGVVCAALLRDAVDPKLPIKWADPNDVQKQVVNIIKGDILANLPYDDRCSLWFDHHISNQIDQPFEGAFQIAPSAAGVVYAYYQDRLGSDYRELINATDRIDSADLTLIEVLEPEKHSYILLSMTVTPSNKSDETYWCHLVELLRQKPIDAILADGEVSARCRAVVKENQSYRKLLQEYTILKGQVAITDFRSLGTDPPGNRFLIYSLFPEAVVSIKVRFTDTRQQIVAISVGHSIFNRNCRVNVGNMLKQFGGGGHRGAASCRVAPADADSVLANVIKTLQANKATASESG